jgi:hypothetical protein
MRVAAFFLCFALLITGCGKSRQITDDQAQHLADARAGAAAVMELLKTVEIDPVGANLVLGSCGFLIGGTANIPDMPAALVSAEQLLASPDAGRTYADRGAKAAKDPAGGDMGLWFAIGSGALAALGIALKIGRNIPGIGGTIAGLMQAGLAFAPDSFRKKILGGEQVAGHAIEYAKQVEALVLADPVMAEQFGPIIAQMKIQAHQAATQAGHRIDALLAPPQTGRVET